MTNFLFEWKRLKKSRLLYISLIASFTMSLFFFLYQSYRVEQVHEENREHIEFEMSYRERSIELSDWDENDEYMDEDYLAYVIGRQKSYENQIPYLNRSLTAYLDGDYEGYYQARMDFIEAVAREEGEFVDSSWLFSEEDYEAYLNDLSENILPLLDEDPLLEEYESLLVYQEIGEPIESEEASIVLPNHLIMLGKTFLFPMIVSFLIILSSLLIIEDQTESSLHMRTVETGSTSRYLLSSSLFACVHFIIFIVSTYSWSALIATIFGNPLFNEAPTWQSPVLVNGEVIEGMTLVLYFLIINLILLVCYLLFFTLFQFIHKILRQTILSIMSLFTVAIIGYYLTQSFEALQHWFNPFQLFFFDQWVLSNQINYIYYGIGVTILFSMIGFTIVAHKKST